MFNEQFLYGRPTFPAQLNMSHPLTRGLVGCWVMNEPEGMRALDSCPYQNHGLETGATGRYEGRRFNGTDDYILIDDTSNILNLTSALTYEVWVNPTDGGGNHGRFLSKTTADPYTTRVVMLGKELADETDVRWDMSVVGPLNTGAGAMVADAWNHVIGTIETSGANVIRYIFVNGIQRATATAAGSIESSAGGVFWMGALFTINQNFKGDIGEARVYNRALSASEVGQLYLDPYEMFLK